jgi:hypothetical protein
MNLFKIGQSQDENTIINALADHLERKKHASFWKLLLRLNRTARSTAVPAVGLATTVTLFSGIETYA